MNFYTYIYRDPSRNNEPIYVGKGKNRRAWCHLRKGNMHPFVQRLQYMAKNNVKPLIEIIDAEDEEFAFFFEAELISHYGRKDLNKGPLLNLTDGGEGGINPSSETRAKMSAVNKGKPKSLEQRGKMSAAKKGKTFSAEHRQKISDSQKVRLAAKKLRIQNELK